MMLVMIFVLALMVQTRATEYSHSITTSNMRAKRQAPRELNENDFRVICYLSRYFALSGKMQHFSVEQLDTKLCTHVTYAIPVPPSANYGYEKYELSVVSDLTSVKKIDPKIKTLLTLRASSYYLSFFKSLTRSHFTRKEFVRNTVVFLRERNIDGVNFYIEMTISYKVNYQILMEELREAFDNDARDKGLPCLLLVSTVKGLDKVARTYDIPNLVKCSDFLIVAPLSFYGHWDGFTYFQSPLYDVPGQIDQANVDYTAWHYVKLGATKKSITIAVPMFAVNYTLNSHLDNGIRSPSNKPNLPEATLRNINRNMAFYEVCNFIKSGAETRREPPFVNFYAVLDLMWVSFEDITSVKERTCYAKTQGFGGVMLYYIDYDDFSGTSCDQGKYPLAKSAFNVATSQVDCNGGLLASRNGAHRQAQLIYTGGKLISNGLLIIRSLLIGLYVMQSTI